MSASETTDAQLRLRNERMEFRDGFCVVPVGAIHDADDEITALRAEVARLKSTGRVVADEPWVKQAEAQLRAMHRAVDDMANDEIRQALEAAIGMFPAPREDHVVDANKKVADAEAEKPIEANQKPIHRANDASRLVDADAEAGAESDDTAEYSQLEMKPDATGMFVNAQGDHIPLDRPVADWLRWYFAWKGDTTTRLEQLEHLRRNMIGARVHGQLIRQIDDILDAEHAAPEGD